MINIYFEYKGKMVTLPINPEELTIDVPGNNENANVVGLGEINILRKPRLSPISISSFFSEDDDPQQYIEFFKAVQADAKPMQAVCKDFKLNMSVGIDGFQYSIRAGEEGDRYYTLELQEWRDYSPIVVGKEVTTAKVDTVQTPPPETKTAVIVEFSKGDIVTFTGGNHYVASTATTPTGGNRSAGKAKITNKAMGAKHPYHLIGVPGGSNVYGWVDREQVTK